MRAGRIVVVAVIGTGVLSACGRTGRELPVYLSWSTPDTSTTMTVHYHTVTPYDGSHVYYDRVSRDGDPAAYAFRASGWERPVPGADRSVHVVELSGLEPGATYYFVAGDPLSGFSAERRFRTVPDDGSPITFVVGGDMSTGFLARWTSRRAARERPSFVLLGGDLAYGQGRPQGYDAWLRWFEDWEATMRTPDGSLVPAVLAIGNHEVNGLGADESPERRAPFYFSFFHQHPSSRSYFLRRIGPHAVVAVLDSGHIAAHGGAQRDWLEAALRESRRLPFRFALYHTALFPAHHSPEDEGARQGRELWAPLFDAFGLSTAFEHHGHVHKRTHPIRWGKPAANGVGTVYLGDGGWGKSEVRQAYPERWYLARSIRRRHYWRVTVTRDETRYTAIAPSGRVLDRSVQRPRLLERSVAGDAGGPRAEAEDLVGGLGANVARAAHDHVVQGTAGDVEPAVGSEAETVGPAQQRILEQGAQASVGL